MRLLIAGNIANTGFYLTSKLREKGIFADLYMEKNPIFVSDPKNSGKLGGEYPDWIKFWDREKNWKRNLVSTMRKYDLISAATELPIFAQFSLKPYVAVATGSDLNLLAQSKSFKGMLLKSGYKRAKVVVYNLPTHLQSAKKLNLKNAVFLPLFREFQMLETNGISDMMIKNKFVFFHPTSQRWNIKKNYLFLKAFSRLSKSYDNVFLIIINHGEDASKAIDFLSNAGIDDKFKILPETLTQKEMIKYYNSCDAVVDQFGVGAFGFTGLEVLSIGKPLVCYIRKDVYETLYGEAPPVLSSNNEEGIYNILKDLVEGKELCEKLSFNSQKWMQKFHSPDSLITKYIKMYEMVYDGKKIEEIYEEIKFY